MYGWDTTGHMGFMWLWWLLGIAIVAAIVWAALARPNWPNQDSGVSAEEILKRRYARGEIDDEEYRRRLEQLRR